MVPTLPGCREIPFGSDTGEGDFPRGTILLFLPEGVAMANITLRGGNCDQEETVQERLRARNTPHSFMRIKEKGETPNLSETYPG